MSVAREDLSQSPILRYVHCSFECFQSFAVFFPVNMHCAWEIICLRRVAQKLVEHIIFYENICSMTCFIYVDPWNFFNFLRMWLPVSSRKFLLRFWAPLTLYSRTWKVKTLSSETNMFFEHVVNGVPLMCTTLYCRTAWWHNWLDVGFATNRSRLHNDSGQAVHTHELLSSTSIN